MLTSFAMVPILKSTVDIFSLTSETRRVCRRWSMIYFINSVLVTRTSFLNEIVFEGVRGTLICSWPGRRGGLGPSFAAGI